MAMKVSKMCVTAGTVQLHDVAKSWAKKPILSQLGAPGTSLLIGNQNTEKPYAMPIHKWMAKAAGGTSQRLKRGPAMVRSLVNNPDVDPVDADTPSGTTVMDLSPGVSTLQMHYRHSDMRNCSPIEGVIAYE
jgi:hypothetical protein